MEQINKIWKVLDHQNILFLRMPFDTEQGYFRGSNTTKPKIKLIYNFYAATQLLLDMRSLFIKCLYSSHDCTSRWSLHTPAITRGSAVQILLVAWIYIYIFRCCIILPSDTQCSQYRFNLPHQIVLEIPFLISASLGDKECLNWFLPVVLKERSVLRA